MIRIERNAPWATTITVPEFESLMGMERPPTSENAETFGAPRMLGVKTPSRECSLTVHSLVGDGERLGHNDENLVLCFPSMERRDKALEFLESTFSPSATLVDQIFKPS